MPDRRSLASCLCSISLPIFSTGVNMSSITIVGVIVLVLLVGTGIFLGFRYKHARNVPDQNRSSYQTIPQTQPVRHVSGDPMVTYLTMRNRAFDGSRAQFGIPPGPNSTDPWATVMELGL